MIYDKDGGENEDVADAGDDEGLHPAVGGWEHGRRLRTPEPLLLRVAVVEAYESVAADPDALPSYEYLDEVVGEDEEEHATDEELEEEPVAGEVGVAVHIPKGVDDDEEGDEGDDVRHDDAQGIDKNPDL